jgi:hypothetical protein
MGAAARAIYGEAGLIIEMVRRKWLLAVMYSRSSGRISSLIDLFN